MLFTEPAFLFFFLPVVLGVSLVLRGGLAGNVWLLSASLLFFTAGEPRWAWLLVVSVGWNYGLGLAVSAGVGGWRKVMLGMGVGVNLVPLVGFKVMQGLGVPVMSPVGGVPSGLTGGSGLLIPLGLSFYTFHAVSYLVDVYRGTSQAVRSPVRFGLYMAMFPQLIAGPIVRYRQVAAELARRRVTAEDFAEGVRRFVFGLGKKVLIADPLGVRADAVFALPAEALDAPTAWIGVVCYGLQVYFDFSGYSDMAIGLARMLGFRFPENFDYPYAARSVGDFWRRWHITLMTFFRDYVYIPLGGNRLGQVRTATNVIGVFVLSAVWHCPSWMFLGRAGFFAGLLIGERVLAERLRWRPPRWAQHGYLLAVVAVGWVVFRSETWEQAAGIYTAMLGLAPGTPTLTPGYLLTPDVVIAGVAGVAGCTRWPRELAGRALKAMGTGRGAVVGWVCEVAVVVGVLAASVVVSAAAGRVPFLYYKF